MRALAASVQLGSALAAPTLLPVLEWFRASGRMAGGLAAAALGWQVPPAAWLALALPSFAAHWTTWDPFAPAVRRAGVELAGGLVPLAGLVAGLVCGARVLLRRASAELAVLLAAALFAMLPGWGPFRYSFRWLPLVQLALALAGARGLEVCAAAQQASATAGRARRPRVAAPLLAVALVATAWALDPGVELGVQAPPQGGELLAVATLLLLLGWLVGSLRWPASASAPAIAAASLVLAWATLALGGEVPRWDLSAERLQRLRLAPGARALSLDRRTDFYGLDGRRAGDGDDLDAALLPGNLAQLVGVTVIDGYSPFGHPGFLGVAGYSIRGVLESELALARLLPRETGADGWTALAAVDTLLLPTPLADRVPALAAQGWRLAARRPEALVLARPPLPRVRSLATLRTIDPRRDLAAVVAARPPGSLPAVARASEALPPGEHVFAPARVERLVDARNRSTAWVEVAAGGRPALVLFARCWYPGLRAWIGEPGGEPGGNAGGRRELPVVAVADLLPAVVLPAGARGTITVAYRPRSLELGLLLATGGVAVAMAAMWRARRRARASRGPSGVDPGRAAGARRR
jgi:hypothetical protein